VGASAGRVILTADRLIDGTGGPPVDRPAVTLDDGWIVAVERREEGWTPALRARVVEEPGATIVPGYVDAHLHLAFPAPNTSPADADQRRLAVSHARACLLGGVTTLRDLGSGGAAGLHARDAWSPGFAGPRILSAGLPITTPDGHCHWFGRHAVTGADLRAAVRELVAGGADVIKVMATGGMTTPGTDPRHPQYSVAALAAAVDEAHRLGRRVAAHALGTAGVRAAIAAGVDTLEHGWTITGREQGFDPAVVDEVRQSRVTASVTAHEALRSLLPSDDAPGDLAELRRRLVPHRALADAGVPIIVHSDCGPHATRYDGFGESIRAFALGMAASVPEAIRAATLVPATALGLDDEIGAVTSGRRADLVVLDGDPTTDLGALSRIRRVLRDGQVVVGAAGERPPA
jgi:imidazolonepropionase-like amidohydrolase